MDGFRMRSHAGAMKQVQRNSNTGAENSKTNNIAMECERLETVSQRRGVDKSNSL